MTKNDGANQALFFIGIGPYDEDDVSVLRFESTEGISTPFALRVEFASRADDLDFDAVVGAKANLTCRGPFGERYLHGITTEFSQGERSAHHYFYEVTIRPRLWLLSQRSDCRIFQQMSAPDIVREVMQGHGLSDGSDYEFSIGGDYAEREYCVQYRESDLDFISRLMEEEGIFYFFRNGPERSVVVFADECGTCGDLEGGHELRLAPPGGMLSEADAEQVFGLSFLQRVRPGAVVLDDYEFKQPTLDLSAKEQVSRNAELEIFEFPGHYVEPARGKSLAKVRLQEAQTSRKEVRGKSNCLRFSTGARFELVEHPREDCNRGYILTELHQRGASPQALEEDVAFAPEGRYANEFVAIPDDVPFRPTRKTRRPTVRGSQTAVVVGPAGEEIYTDEHGRVKVQFFWDRYGKSDQVSSCWIRCSQPWAGPGWGGLAIPRIGQEVVIDFIEGNPDRPLIVGRVYNGDVRPPQELPAAKANMTIRSQSLGGSGGSNEITMNDTGGEEGLFIHAQYNMNEVVENDRTERVGNNESITIGVNRVETVGSHETISIGANRTEDVGSNETITIGVDRTETVGANETISIGANRSETVGANETVTVGVMRTHSIGVNDMLNVGAAQEVSVGGVQAVTVGGFRMTTVGMDDTLTVGKTLTIDVADEITIKTGDASITLKKDGTIALKGKDISVKGSGKIAIKADSDVTIKGSKIAQN